MEKKKIFSEEERTLLLDLLSRHRSVVENKRTDAASMSKKRDSWKKIQDEFNCRHNVTPRTWTQLKKCWENMKDKWRRTSAEDMRERFATGCDNYDEPTDPWSWDDISSPLADASTGTALAHGQAPDTSKSPPEAAAAPPTTPASAAAASTSSAAALPSKRSTSRIQRQTAVSTELGARLDAIKEERQRKKKEHL
ncbi:hypothetical protein HPB52_025254 [Rhipicephalus sanguineus]|uniref:Regulatory protein zeste n=1 Tax=Rhipicephalus sanguineus TaxID=34632 RepID=A0A9D4TDA8_RHISA|nr:hypothetical protein HPB52_025254 [Rhipicephalus sanguineus]